MNTIEHVEYLEVIAASADHAKSFAGRADEPIDLGAPPAEYWPNGKRRHRYNPNMRVWGFEAVQS